MPTRNLDRNIGGYCKIRKRVSSSSNSSVTSSFVKNYRLKRPVWKMPLRSPSVVVKSSPVVDKGKDAKVSARRLAATLWEINGGCDEEKENSKADYSPLYKGGSRLAKHKRRTSEKLQLIEYVGGEGKDSSVHHGNSVKVSSPSSAARMKDLSTSLTTSKELIKVLFRMCSQEDRNSSNLTLVSALKVEIDRARHHVDHLMQEKKSNKKEIDTLMKNFGVEKAVWKRKEQERLSNAVSSVVKELEIEKKLRRQTERINKTLGRELAETKTRLNKAIEDLECERKACDECDKVREETERERQMLQLADVLREERVQMKLADARYEYEEKNEVLERLRNDLEAYLGERVGDDSGESGRHSIELNLDSRRTSVDEMFKGRRSLNEKIQWESICLQRKTSEKKITNANGLRKGRFSDDRGDEVLLLCSGGGEGCSRTESLAELVMDTKPDSVDFEDRVDGNYYGGT